MPSAHLYAYSTSFFNPLTNTQFRYWCDGRALVCSLSRAGFGLVGYPHHRLCVRATNEYDRARAVFTVILGLALILLQWLSAFWTINHLQIPISRIGRDYVKLL